MGGCTAETLTMRPPLLLCLQHELGQLVLKRFLLLVLLLDKAATHLTAAFRTPLLFKLTASIKSSRQVSSSTCKVVKLAAAALKWAWRGLTLHCSTAC